MEKNKNTNTNTENNAVETKQTGINATETKQTAPSSNEPTLQELKDMVMKLKAENEAKDVAYEKLKKHFDNASAEASKYKKDYQAKLTDEEVKKIELEERQAEKDKEFEEMKNKLKTIETTKRYIAFGFDEKTAEICAKAEADNDMDSILKNIKSFNEANIKKKEQEWLNNGTDPMVGGNVEIEKDDFLKGFDLGSK